MYGFAAQCLSFCSNILVSLASQHSHSHSATMSAQTSNLPIQTPQQSRTVYSNNIIPISSYSQRPGMMATTNLGAPKKVTPKYYEEYGLCVPLIKHGQKRPHARAACELASKSKAGLLEIVKDLAPSKVAKLKSASKSDILQWIERVETLALGPHPKTQLPCKSTAPAHRVKFDFRSNEKRRPH